MKNSFSLKLIIGICLGLFAQISYGQYVGVGTTAPVRSLHVSSNNGVYSALKLTNNASGNTASDGFDFGFQYQGDYEANRYGIIMINEAIPLRIGTNGQERIRIVSNGRIGINTTLPGQQLDVKGSIMLSGTGKRVEFRNSGDTTTMGSIGYYTDNIISIAHNNPFQSSKFFFDVENEKLGIGAVPGTSDGKILVHYNSSLSNPHMTLRESILGDYSRLEFANTGATRTWHFAGQNVAGAGSVDRGLDILNIWNSGYGDIMSFRGDGRVGILTSSPAVGYALSVNGRIICEELRVQNSTAWPDYVFANDYPLMPISDLSQFIAKNKHLPRIPTAATVEKEGIAVGDMQVRMMEKIEELTLYILQQQQQLDAQKLLGDENKTLSKQVEIQQARIDKQQDQIKSLEKLVKQIIDNQ